LQQGQQPAQNQ